MLTVHCTDVILGGHLAVVQGVVATVVLHDETVLDHLGKLIHQLGILSSTVCE